MDVRTTMLDILRDVFTVCEARGPTMALGKLRQRIPADRVESSEYLRALFDAYQSASAAEKRKMKRAAEDLECLGIYLPRDYLFSLGTPRKEFGLRIDFE